MGLQEKFLDRIQAARSIEELEAIGADFGKVRGLSDEETDAIRVALTAAFDQAATLDETIDDAGPEVVQELQAEAETKRALEVQASASLTGMPMELSEGQVEATVKHFELFEKVKRSVLDDRVDVLYIGSGGAPLPFAKRKGASTTYIRKSGWRKLAMVFGVNLKVLEMDREVHQDANGPYYLWHARVRAEHLASGKYAEGIGVASSRDQFFTRGGKRAADEKDIKLKSQTVGENRAISNLIGGGAMSAEEAEDGA